MGRENDKSPATLLLLSVFAAAVAACSGDDGASGAASPASPGSAPSEQQATTNPNGLYADSRSAVFPEALARGFDEEITEALAAGGTAGVGRICRGGGADVFYVGVNGANWLPDGQHSVQVDPIDETFVFQTGAPDSGVGAGAGQTTFDEPEYTFTFEDLDVVITIAGCAG